MNYNNTEIQDTYHYFVRAKERGGLKQRRAQRMIDLARERGKRSNECRWSVDKQYLACRNDSDKEAIAYNGYCFIISKDTGSCITLYPLPADFGKKKSRYKKSYLVDADKSGFDYKGNNYEEIDVGA